MKKSTYPALSPHPAWDGTNKTKGESTENKGEETKFASGFERDCSATHTKGKVAWLRARVRAWYSVLAVLVALRRCVLEVFIVFEFCSS